MYTSSTSLEISFNILKLSSLSKVNKNLRNSKNCYFLYKYSVL